MPRSILRPQVGSVVWYYANVTPPAPLPAMVVHTVDRTHFDLCVFNADGATFTPALNTPYYDAGSRPAAGAWCTYMRTQENVANTWPKMYPNTAPLGVGGVSPLALEAPVQQEPAAIAHTPTPAIAHNPSHPPAHK
jgi:hypothetical protein